MQIDRVVRQMWAERPGAYLRVLFAQMGARCASWATLYAVIHALGLGYSFGLVSLLYAGLNVAEFVVAVLPARLGVAEGTAFMLFGVAGLPQEAAILIYVVQRLKSIATHALLAPFARVGRP